MKNDIPRIVLDDGQVIQGNLRSLSQHQLISYANQLYRQKRKDEARDIMEFQHQKFHQGKTPTTPEAA
jgi:hypothetical protein